MERYGITGWERRDFSEARLVEHQFGLGGFTGQPPKLLNRPKLKS
jgi:hypothetical protein